MPNRLAEALWVFDRLVVLVKLFIWPAFLWFFTKRNDVKEHIAHLVRREWRVRVPGATIRITSPETARRLPRTEVERELSGPPEPLPIDRRPRPNG